jgi:tetratricopeptide (TPR) repeat protein
VLCHLSTYIAIQGRFAEAHPFLERGKTMAERLQDPEALLAAAETLMEATYDIDGVTAAFNQAVSLLEQQDHPARTARLAGVHTRYGDRLRDAGRFDEAQAHYQESLKRLRKLGNVDLIAYPIGNLGRLALHDRRLQDAYDLISESVSISRRIGNRVGIADWVWQLGHVALLLGDTIQAEGCFEEALALYAEIGNRRAIPDMLSFLGNVALLQDDIQRATSYFEQSLSAYKDTFLSMESLRADWNSQFTTAFIGCLMGMAVVVSKRNALENTVKLLGFVDRAWVDDQHPIEAMLQSQADLALGTARYSLAQADFETAWKAGQTMSVEDVLNHGTW